MQTILELAKSDLVRKTCFEVESSIFFIIFKLYLDFIMNLFLRSRAKIKAFLFTAKILKTSSLIPFFLKFDTLPGFAQNPFEKQQAVSKCFSEDLPENVGNVRNNKKKGRKNFKTNRSTHS